jgi:hypothetical protein
MKKLLQVEWMKLKNYRAFIVLISLFGVGIILSNYIVFSVNKSIVGQMNTKGMLNNFRPYDFRNTWETTSYVSGWLLMLPAMLMIILITNEYTFRTSRQNIIDGWTRSEFIRVKLLLGLILAIATTIVVIITALAFGIGSGKPFSSNGISNVAFFFLKAVSYNVIAVFIAVLVRKTGFAIGLFFIYMGAENIIAQLLDVWSIWLKQHHYGDFGSMGDYLPMNAADGLLSFPDSPFKSLAKSALPTDYTSLVMILAVVYLVLFTYLAERRFVRKDL